MKEFVLKKGQLYQPQSGLKKGGNGQITIIGGSSLFHGAPLFPLKVASRIVDMVFFASPEPSVGKVAEKLKSKLLSFIWVPWLEIGDYIKKSDAVLIGPGLMRYRQERKKNFDDLGKKSKEITEKLLAQFPNKQWVIDAGSLQVINSKFIPKKAILTPNKKEYKLLFGGKEPQKVAKKYRCLLICKNQETIVYSHQESRIIKNKETPLTKGGFGDVLAGLTVALSTKNPPFLAACASSWLMMKAIDKVSKKVGNNFNADDLTEALPGVLKDYL